MSKPNAVCVSVKPHHPLYHDLPKSVQNELQQWFEQLFFFTKNQNQKPGLK